MFHNFRIHSCNQSTYTWRYIVLSCPLENFDPWSAVTILDFHCSWLPKKVKRRSATHFGVKRRWIESHNKQMGHTNTHKMKYGALINQGIKNKIQQVKEITTKTGKRSFKKINKTKNCKQSFHSNANTEPKMVKTIIETKWHIDIKKCQYVNTSIKKGIIKYDFTEIYVNMWTLGKNK